METQLEAIRDQQKESWNKFSPGWKKWDTIMMDFLRPMGEEIIRLINPKNGEIILDVAAGTGEPGLTIAEMIKSGKVISTDLAEGMLEVAMENAEKRGIKNFETRVCDVGALPFENDTFDAVSCRFGFMFFPDMAQSAKEMVRVLKPGGRLATSVWNKPEKNFWITAIMSTINKHMEIPPQPPGSPGMFRCAESGLIAGLFEDAGLNNVSENEVAGKLKGASTETYWNMMTDVAAPFVAALSKADDELKARIKREVFGLVNNAYPEGEAAIDSSALVIYGVK